MEVKVACKYAKIAPRKVRLVIDLIRGVKVDTAFNTLRLTRKRACPVISKLLKSAVATAAEKHDVEADDLIVSGAWVDGGPMKKGWWARPRGMAARLRYRTSHITLVVTAPEQAVEQGEANRP